MTAALVVVAGACLAADAPLSAVGTLCVALIAEVIARVCGRR